MWRWDGPWDGRGSTGGWPETVAPEGRMGRLKGWNREVFWNESILGREGGEMV